jgi:lysophospholipase L1-like esterase
MSGPATGETPVSIDARPKVQSARYVLKSKPVRAALTLIALGTFTELVPGLARYRLFRERPAEERNAPLAAASSSVGEARLETETLARPDPRASRSAPRDESEPALPQINAEAPPLPVLDPSGRALDGFFRALGETARKKPGAITRIAHFGDSIVVSDLVSGTLRRKFQDQFGDAGHGFMLIANAWPAYFHNDVTRYATAGWSVSRIVGPYAADGLYGLGGVSFKADAHALARFGTAKSGNHGRAASRFVLSYLDQPGGGEIEIAVDGVVQHRLATEGPLKKSAFYELRVPDGEHEFSILTTRGVSRAFGVVLEREVPGVVLDALGVQGARIRFLDKQDDAHWAEQLKWRDPRLVIYQFGANESGDGFLYSMDDYSRTMKDVLLQGKRALPESSCLVLGAMDRAAKVGEKIVSVRVIPFIVEEQRKAALEVGCAFFDVYTAMGGQRSMPTWVRRGLGQADLTHPTAVGSEVIGNWVYRALMQNYDAYLRRAETASAATSP